MERGSQPMSLPSATILQSILENIGAAYLLESADRKIIMVNDDFCSLFKLNAVPEQLIGQDCTNAAQHVKHLFANADNFVSHTEHLVKAGKKNTGEILRMTDGTTLLRNFRPVQLGDGIDGLLWSYMNISEHIFLEELEIQLALNYFVSSLYKENSVDEVLQNIAKNSISQLGFVDCVIYVMDEQRQVLIQKAAWGPKASCFNTINNPLEIPVGKGIVGYVAKTAIAEIVSDTSKDNRYIVDDQLRLSEIAVPIVLNGKVIGVIDSEHPNAGFYTQKHLVILSTIASLCATKIQQLNTEQEKQKEIIQQKDFYEQILNGIPADIAVFAPDHRYLFVNPQGIKDDWVRKWIINKRDEDYCDLRDKPHWIFETRRNYFNEALRTKKLVSWEEKLVRPDGSDNWIIRTFHPLIGEDENISLVIGYGINITDRKKAELFGKESEKKLRELFDYSPVMIITHDMNYKILTANAATKNVLGLAPSEVIDKNLLELALTSDTNISINNYKQLLASRIDITGVIPLRHVNGDLIYLLCNAHKVTAQDEAPYVIAFCQDITKMIIAEKKLKEAKRITEETALEKERFWAATSHELRTPLNGIIGISDLLNKSKNEIKNQKYISILQHSAQTLLNIINNVLDIERIQSGNVIVHRQLFSIRHQIELLTETFEPLAEKKGLHFHIENKFKEDIVLEGDQHKMHQILSNLISNAIKFTQTGFVKIHLSAGAPAKKDSSITLCFSIKDSGWGIPPEMIEKIFEPFIQIHDPERNRESGSGLGLTICKQLTDLLSGSLTVKSIIGKGSEFTLCLPFKKANHHAAVIEIDPAKHKFIDTKKILLAEDSYLNQFIIKEMLNDYNIELDIVQNGQEAVQMAGKKAYDLVLMDIQMPVMDGKIALQTIRSSTDQLNLSTPIVSLSANAFEKDMIEYRNAGFTDSLTKPFTETMLMAMIRKHIPATVKEKSQAINNKKSNLDLSYLIHTGKGKKQFVEMMLKNFLEQVPVDSHDLKSNYSLNDLSSLAKTAHKLKFAFGVIGAYELQQQAVQIENIAKNGTSAEKEYLHERLETLFEQIKQLVAEIQQRLDDDDYMEYKK